MIYKKRKEDLGPVKTVSYVATNEKQTTLIRVNNATPGQFEVNHFPGELIAEGYEEITKLEFSVVYHSFGFRFFEHLEHLNDREQSSSDREALKKEILPKMYCYMGSGMLSNTYDDAVANQMADECMNHFDAYMLGQFAKAKTNHDKELMAFGLFLRDEGRTLQNKSISQFLEEFRDEEEEKKEAQS